MMPADIPPPAVDYHQSAEYQQVISLPATVPHREQKRGTEDLVPTKIRLDAIREAAETLGVQAGLAYRYEKITSVLNGQAQNLERIYDFRLVMIGERVLPPIYTESRAGWSKKGRTKAVYNAVTYEVIQPAVIVSRPPNWRDYLLKRFPVKLEIPPALVPENRAEQQAWTVGVERGWQAGMRQANHLFRLGLARLERDLVGAARYHLLVRQGIVKKVLVQEAPGQVIIEGNVLSVDQKFTQLTRDASYQKEVGKWEPLVISPIPTNR
ncbi:type IV secretory system conjugative DNA transfer family protein [Thiolapillus sp.]|uniref:type IV secretory system conjugative DNA transfer family protein n=1 Tax=Thiolapillus sp. TaxID=2017437 RepID=UPI003AF88EC2